MPMFFVNNQAESFTAREKSSFRMHLVIALLCLPIYLSPVNALFGLLIAPYIFFMVFQAKKEYLLPLIVHTFWGSQQRYLMLTACFIYCLFHFNAIMKRKLSLLFIIYLCIFPFFVWYTYKRYVLFGGGIGMGGTFNGLGYYFAFAPFFWAVASNMRLTKENFKWSVVIGAALVLFWMLGGRFCRADFWALVLAPALLYWLISTRKAAKEGKEKIRRMCLNLAMAGVVVVLIGFIGVLSINITFTQIGAIGFACIYLFLAHRCKHLAIAATPIIFFALSALLVVYTIKNYDLEKDRYVGGVAYDQLKITDVSSFKEKLSRKTFSDRAPLWTAAWNSIRTQYAIDPIWVNPIPIAGTYGEGENERTISLMAHNIALLLLQEYGLWGGAGLYLLYILIFSRAEIRRAMVNDFDSYYALIGAACLGHAIMGGHAGQYVMNVEFSFLLYSMLGCVFNHYYNIVANKKQNSPVVVFLK